MTYLISGSVVLDNILIHNGKFQHSILPEKIDNLNVSFDLQEIRTERGGTGANILHNAQILASSKDNIPSLLTHIGSDFEHNFASHFGGMNAEHLKYLKEDFSKKGASCFILNANDGNQITSFYQGVMANKLEEKDIPIESFEHFLLSPENPNNTILVAKLCASANKNFYFDPGQCTPIFIQHFPQELHKILKTMSGLFVNEYEADLIKSFTGDEINDIFNINENLKFIIVTKGSKGYSCFERGTQSSGICATPNSIVDATGCGDAFRAGFFHGYIEQKTFSAPYGCLHGTIMASFAIENYGGQNHNPSFNDIDKRKEQHISNSVRHLIRKP